MKTTRQPLGPTCPCGGGGVDRWGHTLPHIAPCPIRLARDAERTERALARVAEAARRAAEAERKMRGCEHSWFMLSHEEKQCRYCGAVEFVPDL